MCKIDNFLYFTITSVIALRFSFRILGVLHVSPSYNLLGFSFFLFFFFSFFFGCPIYLYFVFLFFSPSQVEFFSILILVYMCIKLSSRDLNSNHYSPPTPQELKHVD